MYVQQVLFITLLFLNYVKVKATVDKNLIVQPQKYILNAFKYLDCVCNC